MRRVLLDMARHYEVAGRGMCPGGVGPAARLPGTLSSERGDSGNGPATLAMWTEFHHKVAELPAEERDVVNLHWYQGLTQTETARLLGIHRKEVSRRWISARLKFSEWLPGREGRAPDGG